MDVGFEDFAGLVLGEGYIVAVHFTLAGDFTNCHYLDSFLASLTMALKASG